MLLEHEHAMMVEGGGGRTTMKRGTGRRHMKKLEGTQAVGVPEYKLKEK
jgi:hypothetical protein